MYTRAIHVRKLRATIIVKALADGDTATVTSVFERLSSASRAARFHGTKPTLSERELAELATVGPDRHVLVAYVGRDPRPAALARLVRDSDDRRRGEIAFEVADCDQGLGIATALVRLLLEDGRAAGIDRVEAFVQPSNRAALGLLRRVFNRASLRFEDGTVLVSSA